MGKLMFGWEDNIKCIQPVELKGQNNETLCLAFKHSKLFIGAGVYVRDDGYVLGDPAQKGVYYPWPADAAQVETWQSAGLLPKPLPEYSIPLFDYAFGYSLWIIIAGMVLFAYLRRLATKRRQARDALIPVSLGPPKVVTDADRFITEAVRTRLAAGETLQHQAFTTPDPENTTQVMFIALTNQRLLVMHSQRKLFKVLHEVQTFQELPRADIISATESSYELTLKLRNGGSFSFWVPKSEKEYSNQKAFVRDVPRLLSNTAATGPAVSVVG